MFKKKVKFSWIGIIAIVLCTVALAGLVSRATGGFTHFGLQRNEDNLFFDVLKDGDLDLGGSIYIDAKVKDGVITLDGLCDRSTTADALEYTTDITVCSLTLPKGTYTFTANEDASLKSAYMFATFTTTDEDDDDVTHWWYADQGDAPAVDGHRTSGAVAHGETLALDAETTITVYIAMCKGVDFNEFKFKPVIVDGKDAGNFYLNLLGE